MLETKDLLRKADNRIPHNFHQLITDEEVDYLLSYAPIVDIGEEEANKAVTAALGDNFLKISRTLDVEACNSGCAWLHYWVDVTKKSLVYASVPSDQIIPIMADSLEHKMDKLIRYYMITKTEGATKKKLHSRRIVGQLEMQYFLLPGDLNSASLLRRRQRDEERCFTCSDAFLLSLSPITTDTGDA